MSRIEWRAVGGICARVAKSILLITSETYTRHIHPLDRSTRTVFGDAATTTLLTEEDVALIDEFALGTDGKGAPNLIIPAGAMAHPKDEMLQVSLKLKTTAATSEARKAYT